MKLIEALEIIKQGPPESAAFAVDLACGFTPLHFQTFLHAHLQRLFPGHKVVVRTGLFGDLLGNLERIEKDLPGNVVAVVEWEDLDPRLGIRRLGGWSPAQLSDIVHGVGPRASPKPSSGSVDGASSRYRCRRSRFRRRPSFPAGRRARSRAICTPWPPPWARGYPGSPGCAWSARNACNDSPRRLRDSTSSRRYARAFPTASRTRTRSPGWWRASSAIRSPRKGSSPTSTTRSGREYSAK